MPRELPGGHCGKGRCRFLELRVQPDALSVTELTAYIRRLFERDALLGRVRVWGELSNYRQHHSGHCYFTI